MILIVVAADQHPTIDDWVRDQAQAEAKRCGLELVDYQGREDTLPWPHPDDVRCHVFTTQRHAQAEG